MSSITILGAYGTKSDTCGSSAFLLNEKHVLDAGHLLKPLKEHCADIETIWLTHSHLDHISDIAFVLDSYYEKRKRTLRICGLRETLDTLKEHFFNHKIWPDFSEIPLYHSSDMSVVYEEVEYDKVYTIGNNTTIKAFPTDHTVASCGYVVEKEENAVLISADTYDLNSVLTMVEKENTLSTLVIECSFPSSMKNLAKESKHLTPELLFDGIKSLESKNIKLYINHLKPRYENAIIKEIEALKNSWDVTVLRDGDSIHF